MNVHYGYQLLLSRSYFFKDLYWNRQSPLDDPKYDLNSFWPGVKNSITSTHHLGYRSHQISSTLNLRKY